MEMKTLVIGEREYMSAVYSAATYNQWLLKDRLQRIPCMERQTRRKHGECTLWYHGYQRQADDRDGYLYTYPWRVEPQKNGDSAAMFDYDIPLSHAVNGSSEVIIDGVVCSSAAGGSNGCAAGGANNTGNGSSSSLYIDIDEALLYANHQEQQQQQASLREPHNQQLSGTSDTLMSRTAAASTPTSNSTSSTVTVKKRKPGRPGKYCPESNMFRCQYCEASYRTKGGLNYHLTHKHRCEQQAEQQQRLYAMYTPPSTLPTHISNNSSSPIKDATAHLRDSVSTTLNGSMCSAAGQTPGITSHTATGSPLVQVPEGITSHHNVDASSYMYCNGVEAPLTTLDNSSASALQNDIGEDDVALITVKKKKRRRTKSDVVTTNEKKSVKNNHHNNNNNNNKDGSIVDVNGEVKEGKRKRKKRKRVKVDEVGGADVGNGVTCDEEGVVGHGVTVVSGTVRSDSAAAAAVTVTCVHKPLTIPVSVSLRHIDHNSNASSDTESYSLQEEQLDD